MLQDVQTEKSVLGAVLQHGKNAWVDIADLVKGNTLASDNNQVYYNIIEYAIGQSNTIDKPLFFSSAHALGFDSIIKDNKKEIDELFSFECDLKNVRINARRLAKLEIARAGRSKLRTAMSEIEKLTGDENINHILSLVEKPGYDIQKILGCQVEDGGLIGKDAVSYIENLIKSPNREIGIRTGFDWYDKAIGGGIRRGGFALIAARRKIGKSSHAVNVAMYVATKLKVPVLYLDTEMKSCEHTSRILAHMTSIPIPSIEHGTFVSQKMFVTQLRDAAKKLETIPITHERVAGKDFSEILAITRRWLMKNVGYHESGKMNNCLIIYDYFKLMNPDNLKSMKEHEALGYQAMELSNFLGEMDVACLAYVQLNQEMRIAQSDRLSWNATSVCNFIDKTAEEMALDGYENGCRKIEFDVARFGEGLEKGNYINIDFNRILCQMREVGTKFENDSDKQIGKSGFRVKDDVDDNDSPF